jgi:hypothetical protein
VASSALPPLSAARAARGSDPLSMTARRTSASGTPAARATASVITPSSAPCRSSPDSSRTRKNCSSAVAAPNSSATSRLRSAADPFPATAPITVNAASTSAIVSDGACAAGGSDRSAAHPTPICRCGSSPDRYATTTGTSSGPASARAAASAATFPSRAGVSPTSRDTPATRSSSTPPFCRVRRAGRSAAPGRVGRVSERTGTGRLGGGAGEQRGQAGDR